METAILFTDSPFSPVADRSTAACWSGHERLRASIARLHNSILNRSDQSLDVMWANLGAGKTHTLYHLEYLFGSDGASQNVIVGFVEIPEQIRGFLDLYRAVIRSLPLRDICLEIAKQSPTGNLAKAANVILYGAAREQEVAIEWLHAGRPHLAELRACSGIATRLEDDISAAENMVGIVSALASSKTRLLLLFDEFQRVGALGANARARMLSSLRTLFSRSPKYLSAVLAIQSMVEQSALKLVPPELQTLIGKKPTICLPELSVDEAEEFVLGRFDFFRPQDFSMNRSAPFADGVLHSTLKYLNEHKGVKLVPREILLALAFVYDAFPTSQAPITEQDALDCLKDYAT